MVSPEFGMRATCCFQLVRTRACLQTTPLLVGLGVAGGALALKFGMENAKHLGRLNWRGMVPRKTNYPGGFKSPMDRKEAALILGVGYPAPIQHRR